MINFQRISTKARPEEVAWWIKRHKQPSSVPKVKVIEFGTEWNSWWRAMQPAWRLGDNRLSLGRNTPSTEDWDALARGGSNGLFLVIMALSWWFKGFAPGNPTAEFWTAVNDVTWVLEGVTSVLSSRPVAQKRSGDEEDILADQPVSKRYVASIRGLNTIYIDPSS